MNSEYSVNCEYSVNSLLRVVFVSKQFINNRICKLHKVKLRPKMSQHIKNSGKDFMFQKES